MKRRQSNFSIHALLAESDNKVCRLKQREIVFLSTLSLRRATRCHRGNHRSPILFYPRSPCGERHLDVANGERQKYFSIHALLAESDLFKNHIFFRHSFFLSTLSLRRATIGRAEVVPRMLIFYPRSPCGERPPNHLMIQRRKKFSIHALLAESDNQSGRCER